jgi:hypothetical protein
MLVTTPDYGCIASAIQALIGLMSVLYPIGLYDKEQVAFGALWHIDNMKCIPLFCLKSVDALCRIWLSFITKGTAVSPISIGMFGSRHDSMQLRGISHR